MHISLKVLLQCCLGQIFLMIILHGQVQLFLSLLHISVCFKIIIDHKAVRKDLSVYFVCKICRFICEVPDLSLVVKSYKANLGLESSCSLSEVLGLFTL